MRDYFESLFGSVTTDELLVVAIIIVAVVLFSRAPRWGERLGAALAGEPSGAADSAQPPTPTDSVTKNS